ncbi:unnamed protein product [Strongylus vulgaris]|uniref:Uncharacterized protein n=1 Tax=Strongylus vulgaris TaxID=40348 RepID=A0A3P7IYU6_STRVU|nr:unnamed protein product [Strongylus vulgaris]
MTRFQGKVVIVTGSSSGIGAAAAVLFAKEGAKVTITGRKQSGLEATKKAILEAGANEDDVNVVIADVTDGLGREQIISSTIQKFGHLDILVSYLFCCTFLLIVINQNWSSRTKDITFFIIQSLGSSSGIGAAAAVLFAKEGAKVTITGRKQSGLEATKKAILEAGANEDDVNVVIADVTDGLGREQIISSTIQKFGHLDILVNNAGAAFRTEDGLIGLDAGTDMLEKTMKVNNAGAAFRTEDGLIGLDASTDMLEKTMKVNVYSVVDLTKLARPHLIKSKGEIVNVSSIAGQPISYAMTAYYAMSKSALDQLMRALAIDLIGEGVRVNSVSPGVVVTRFTQNVGLSDEGAEQVRQIKKDVLNYSFLTIFVRIRAKKGSTIPLLTNFT